MGWALWGLAFFHAHASALLRLFSICAVSQSFISDSSQPTAREPICIGLGNVGSYSLGRLGLGVNLP